MRTCMFALAVGVALAGSSAYAHGPQIQITNDDNQIVTRQIIQDGPYSGALTVPKSVYVIPLQEIGNVWYSQPNNSPSPTIPGAPQYVSGPGFAYGYDLADGGSKEFETASVVSLNFTGGLKLWDGSAFGNAGTTQLKAFRGSDPNITAPEANFAVTADSGPFDNVSLPAVAASYGSEGPEVHSTIRYALLGDGSDPQSARPDGIYLVSLQLSSTQDGLADSDEFLFVLPKNVPYATVSEAVGSLGLAPSEVQWLVPEPGALSLLLLGTMGMAFARHGHPRRKRD